MMAPGQARLHSGHVPASLSIRPAASPALDLDWISRCLRVAPCQVQAGRRLQLLLPGTQDPTAPILHS